MIEISRCNYITGTTATIISYGISEVVKFLETSGRNIIFLHNINSDVMKSFINCSTDVFTSKFDFDKFISDKSNLFRVDLIVIDLIYVKNVSDILSFKTELDKTGIDYIIATNKYHYIEGSNDNVYKIGRENYEHDFGHKYFINDLVNNWKSSIDDLKVSYIRDKKLDDIFGD